MPSRLRECREEEYNTEYYARNKNMGCPKSNTKIVEENLKSMIMN